MKKMIKKLLKKKKLTLFSASWTNPVVGLSKIGMVDCFYLNIDIAQTIFIGEVSFVKAIDALLDASDKKELAANIEEARSIYVTEMEIPSKSIAAFTDDCEDFTVEFACLPTKVKLKVHEYKFYYCNRIPRSEDIDKYLYRYSILPISREDRDETMYDKTYDLDKWAESLKTTLQNVTYHVEIADEPITPGKLVFLATYSQFDDDFEDDTIESVTRVMPKSKRRQTFINEEYTGSHEEEETMSVDKLEIRILKNESSNDGNILTDSIDDDDDDDNTVKVIDF